MASTLPSKQKIHYAPPIRTRSCQCHLHWRRLGPRPPHRRYHPDTTLTATESAQFSACEPIALAGKLGFKSDHPGFQPPGILWPLAKRECAQATVASRRFPVLLCNGPSLLSTQPSRPMILGIALGSRAKERRIDNEARQQDCAHPNAAGAGNAKVVAGTGDEGNEHN